MDKRYQVFVSSTFEDLKEERQAVINAIQMLDYIPAGMELFPAADDDAWGVIQRVIDFSDYYVLVIGGRYGSTTKEGISYTEKEYDYASSVGLPILSFVHAEPDKIPAGKSEIDVAAREKLLQFRKKVESSHKRDTWASADDLKARVLAALVTSVRQRPKIGWVRADIVKDSSELLRRIDDVQREKERLQQENEVLRARLIESGSVSKFKQGDDLVILEIKTKREKETVQTFDISCTWNEVFLWFHDGLTSDLAQREVAELLQTKLFEKW